MTAENVARQATVEPTLTEFSTIYGTGLLIYKIEDFTVEVIENNTPKQFLIINCDFKEFFQNASNFHMRNGFDKAAFNRLLREQTQPLVGYIFQAHPNKQER